MEKRPLEVDCPRNFFTGDLNFNFLDPVKSVFVSNLLASQGIRRIEFRSTYFTATSAAEIDLIACGSSLVVKWFYELVHGRGVDSQTIDLFLSISSCSYWHVSLFNQNEMISLATELLIFSLPFAINNGLIFQVTSLVLVNYLNVFVSTSIPLWMLLLP